MQIEHAASFMLASADPMRRQVHIEPRARDEFTRLPHARSAARDLSCPGEQRQRAWSEAPRSKLAGAAWVRRDE
jgi:hypothetical protein